MCIEKQPVLQDMYLYLFNMVKVILVTRKEYTGTIAEDEASKEKAPLYYVKSDTGEKSAPFALNQIVDIRYIGRLLDFHSKNDTGIIGSRTNEYQFFHNDKASNISSETYDYVKYHEYSYPLSCHLAIGNDGKINAEDVEIIDINDKVHFLTAPILKEENCLYFLGDRVLNDVITEITESDVIFKSYKEKVVKKSEIKNITKTPKAGDRITVQTYDGRTEIVGVVTFVAPDSMMILNENERKLSKVYFSEIERIVWFGKVTRYTPGKGDGGKGLIDYLYEISVPAYLLNAEDARKVTLYAPVRYEIGVSNDKYIAKEIELLREEVNGLWYYGIIAPIYEDGSSDYYKVTNLFNNQDVVQYQARVMKNQDLMNKDYYSVIRYFVREEDASEDVKTAIKYEIIDAHSYTFKEYTTLYVSPEGTVSGIKTFQYYNQKYVGSEAEICLQNGQSVKGRIKSASDSGFKLTVDEKEEEISFSEIKQVYLFGKVTAYNPNNGIGWVEEKFFFHINEVEDKSKSSVKTGVGIRFALENTAKGDKIDCTDISLTANSMYLINMIADASGQRFEKVDTFDFENAKSPEKKQEICFENPIFYSEVEGERKEFIPDDYFAFSAYVYKVTVTESANGGNYEIVVQEKLKVPVPGYVKKFRKEGEKSYVTVVRDEDYKEREGSEVELVPYQAYLLKNFECTDYDYKISYTFDSAQRLIITSSPKMVNKRLFGYIHKENDNNLFGFIIPSEFIETDTGFQPKNHKNKLNHFLDFNAYKETIRFETSHYYELSYILIPGKKPGKKQAADPYIISKGLFLDSKQEPGREANTIDAIEKQFRDLQPQYSKSESPKDLEKLLAVINSLIAQAGDNANTSTMYYLQQKGVYSARAGLKEESIEANRQWINMFNRLDAGQRTRLQIQLNSVKNGLRKYFMPEIENVKFLSNEGSVSKIEVTLKAPAKEKENFHKLNITGDSITGIETTGSRTDGEFFKCSYQVKISLPEIKNEEQSAIVSLGIDYYWYAGDNYEDGTQKFTYYYVAPVPFKIQDMPIQQKMSVTWNQEEFDKRIGIFDQSGVRSEDSIRALKKIDEKEYKDIFASRDDKINEVKIMLKDGDELSDSGRWVLLYGEWRVGKTTVMNWLKDSLEKEFPEKVLVVNYTMSSGEGSKGFIYSTISELYKSIKNACVGKQEIESIFNQIEFSPEDSRNADNKLWDSFKTYLGLFIKELGISGIHLVLLIDEFNFLCNAVESDKVVPKSFLEDWMSKTIPEINLLCVTAGAENIQNLFTRLAPNTLQKGNSVKVNYLTKDQTKSIVNFLFMSKGKTPILPQDNESFSDEIYRLTKGNPFCINQLMNEIGKYLKDNKDEQTKYLSKETITGTLNRLIGKENCNNYEDADKIRNQWFRSLYSPSGEDRSEESLDNLSLLQAIVLKGEPKTHWCKRDILNTWMDETGKKGPGEVTLQERFRILKERGVLIEENDSVSVNVALFSEIQFRIQNRFEISGQEEMF